MDASRKEPQETLEQRITERTHRIHERIVDAASRADRDPDEVTLIAVVKTFGPEVIRAAYRAGLRHFGESYAQDLRDKSASLSDLEDIIWHFIGRIQTNKARYIAGPTAMVHAVDRTAAAEAISNRVERKGLSPPDVLVSVNLADERTKGGTAEEEAASLCTTVDRLPGVKLRGLMTIPPWTENPEDSRPWYRRLSRLGEQVRGKMHDPSVFHLSMGMSHDVEVAIEEGATLVRVGTALLGERKKRG